MAVADARRSQPILRVPVDRVPCALLLIDGSRVTAALFLPPGTSVAGLLDDPEPFLPVLAGDSLRLQARAGLAAIALPAGTHLGELGDELPGECQQVAVLLRSGGVLTGELRWTAPPGRRRTVDLLNQPGGCFALHAADAIYLVAKAQVLWVEEA